MTTRTGLDGKLAAYYRDILYMGTMVEEFLLDATSAFEEGDGSRAMDLVARDEEVDAMQARLEGESVTLLLLQSPVARDLRKIVTSIKVLANLERIGDYAVHLAKLTAKKDPSVYAKYVPRIAEMARAGAGMIRDSITAYIEDDESRATATASRDAEIDARKKELIRELLAERPTAEAEMRQLYRFLSIAKDLERLGDHVTTICEWVVFAVRGDIVDLGRAARQAE
jgi:phosphate transport system protein